MRQIMVLLGLGIAALAAPAGFASSNRLVDYSVVEQGLDKVVEDLFAATGIPIQIQDPGGVIVRNWKASGTASSVIKDLSKRLALHYDFDGVSYELVPGRNQVTSVLRVEGRDRATATKIIRTAFPDYSPTAVRWVSAGQEQNMLMVRGSKRFVETVGNLLKPCPGGCRPITVIRGGLSQNVER